MMKYTVHDLFHLEIKLGDIIVFPINFSESTYSGTTSIAWLMGRVSFIEPLPGAPFKNNAILKVNELMDVFTLETDKFHIANTYNPKDFKLYSRDVINFSTFKNTYPEYFI